MAFLEEIVLCFGINDCHVHLVYPKGIVVSGYKKILELTSSKIVLSLANKNTICICGDELSIKSLAESEIFINGRVVSVEFSK